ncbi:DUF2752 domain-containing protein [Streptomyces sp. NPDC086023]|uniref:DUF2752 domain-containing protein n=1 Tax=Streptomyces sp. NPDC086023 TaxID=3365746 RepID=UPI0037D480E8
MDASRTPPLPAADAAAPAPPADRQDLRGDARTAVRDSRARRLAVPLVTLAGVVGAFAYVGSVDPNEPGHYPLCPLLRLTGVLCPGCGGLRSAHAFAHGDLVTAFGANAMAVLGYLAFAAFTAVWLVRAGQGRPAPRIALKPAWWWLLGAAALAFSVVRNLPVGSALAP